MGRGLRAVALTLSLLRRLSLSIILAVTTSTFFVTTGTFLAPPAAALEKKGIVRGHPAPRPGDCVPRHPLLKSYHF